MADGSNPEVQVSRPSIEIDGQRSAKLTSALQTLDIIEAGEGIYRCMACFGNWGGADSAGFQHFNREQLDFGKKIGVKVDDKLLFEGRITAIVGKFPEGGPARIAVHAEDKLQDLRMTRRTRCFADVSLADVARRIAGEHGLTPQIDTSGPTHKILAQLNQSDLAFLRDLARREDAQIWVAGADLHVATRARRTGASLDLAWTGQLREFEVDADLAHQRTELTAAGWNAGDKEAAKSTANEQAVASELNGGTSGISTLQQAFGARKDTLAHNTASTTEEARAQAEAGMRHLARRFLAGRGVAETQPDLRVGAKLKLTGIGPLFEGEYFVTDVHHRFEGARGLRTEFRCDRPGIGQAGSR
jgi:phage protein D